jgi:hypothetical protein
VLRPLQGWWRGRAPSTAGLVERACSVHCRAWSGCSWWRGRAPSTAGLGADALRRRRTHTDLPKSTAASGVGSHRNADFVADISRRMGTMLCCAPPRALMACVRWDTRAYEGGCSCAGWGAMVRRLRHPGRVGASWTQLSHHSTLACARAPPLAPNRHVPCPTQRTHAIGLWAQHGSHSQRKIHSKSWEKVTSPKKL